MANPFSADVTGFYQFFAADGNYDVALSSGGIPVPFTHFTTPSNDLYYEIVDFRLCAEDQKF